VEFANSSSTPSILRELNRYGPADDDAVQKLIPPGFLFAPPGQHEPAVRTTKSTHRVNNVTNFAADLVSTKTLTFQTILRGPAVLTTDLSSIAIKTIASP
jgi:hypothetical protein